MRLPQSAIQCDHFPSSIRNEDIYSRNDPHLNGIKIGCILSTVDSILACLQLLPTKLSILSSLLRKKAYVDEQLQKPTKFWSNELAPHNNNNVDNNRIWQTNLILSKEFHNLKRNISRKSIRSTSLDSFSYICIIIYDSRVWFYCVHLINLNVHFRRSNTVQPRKPSKFQFLMQFTGFCCNASRSICIVRGNTRYR